MNSVNDSNLSVLHSICPVSVNLVILQYKSIHPIQLTRMSRSPYATMCDVYFQYMGIIASHSVTFNGNVLYVQNQFIMFPSKNRAKDLKDFSSVLFWFGPNFSMQMEPGETLEWLPSGETCWLCLAPPKNNIGPSSLDPRVHSLLPQHQ